MESLLVKDVTYSYRNKYQTVHALSGVSVEFKPGKMYAIIGASGCGKTTFLSLLAGLDVPETGSIKWAGEATATMDRDRYRRESVSVIYQNFNLFQHLTALEAREKLFAVGLNEEHFNRLPNMLSGGEQQRVAIARALVSGSRIILADEPTGNLDSENGRNIVEILKRLAYEEGCCVVIVTHDPAVAAEADITVKMQDGRLAE